LPAFVLVKYGRARPPITKIMAITAVKIAAARWPLTSTRTVVKSPFSMGPRVPIAYRKMPAPMVLQLYVIALYPRRMSECEGTEGVMWLAVSCNNATAAAVVARMKNPGAAC